MPPAARPPSARARLALVIAACCTGWPMAACPPAPAGQVPEPARGLQAVVDPAALGLPPDGAGDTAVLAALGQRAASRPQFPFYAHNPVGSPREIADDILARGWARRTIPAFPVDAPQDWGQAFPRDVEWQVERNAFFHLDPLLQAHRATGEARYLEVVRRGMLDWIRFNLEEDRPNRYKWHDITTGLRAYYLAYLIDHDLRSQAGDARELAALVLAANRHAEVLGRDEMFSMANHSLFVVLGLTALCRALPELAGAPALEAKAHRHLGRFVAAQYGQEGVHLENSPYYHVWVLQRLERIVALGWFAQDAELQEQLEHARANLVYLFRPSGELSRIGDSDPTTCAQEQALHPSLRYCASRGREGQRPAHTNRVFSWTGYAILRSPWEAPPEQGSYLFLHGAFHTRVHKHADDLTFEWFDRGTDLIVDSGKLSYDKNAERDYVLSTRAHNTIEIDGGDLPLDRPTYGSALRAWGEGGGVEFVTAEVQRELGVLHRRALFLRKNAWLLVLDELSAAEEHDYVQWFHFPPRSRLSIEDGGPVFQVPGLGGRLQLVDASGDARPVSVHHGEREPRLQGWVSPSYQQLEPAFALGLAARGRTARFATLLRLSSPNEPAPRVVRSEGTEAVQWVCWRTPAGRLDGVGLRREAGGARLVACGE